MERVELINEEVMSWILERAKECPPEDFKAAALEVEGLIRRQQAAELKAKPGFLSKVLKNAKPISTEELAESFNMTAESLLFKLDAFGILENYGTFGLLKSPYLGMGLTKTSLKYDGKDHDKGVVELFWTQEGQLFVYELLKKNNIISDMEEEADG